MFVPAGTRIPTGPHAQHEQTWKPGWDTHMCLGCHEVAGPRDPLCTRAQNCLLGCRGGRGLHTKSGFQSGESPRWAFTQLCEHERRVRALGEGQKDQVSSRNLWASPFGLTSLTLVSGHYGGLRTALSRCSPAPADSQAGIPACPRPGRTPVPHPCAHRGLLTQRAAISTGKGRGALEDAAGLLL